MKNSTQEYDVKIKVYMGKCFKIRMWLAEKLMYVKYKVVK